MMMCKLPFIFTQTSAFEKAAVSAGGTAAEASWWGYASVMSKRRPSQVRDTDERLDACR
jgi:hypothetical protein